MLDRASGELTYVNAGHNAPIVSGSEPAVFLQATGMPLGLMSDATYESGTANIPLGGALLLFTDGLTDAIPGDDAEKRLCDALADASPKTMAQLRALVNPKFNEDDVTLLLVRRVRNAGDAANAGAT
jgi:serine phosphatase RsbU (regulator of sigma subunit)